MTISPNRGKKNFVIQTSHTRLEGMSSVDLCQVVLNSQHPPPYFQVIIFNSQVDFLRKQFVHYLDVISTLPEPWYMYVNFR